MKTITKSTIMKPYITFTNGTPNLLSDDGLNHYHSLELAIKRLEYKYNMRGIIMCHCTSESGTYSFRIR